MIARYAAQAGPRATTRAMPDSGWFADGDYARDGKPHYGDRMRGLFALMNASAGLDAACVAAHGARCLFAPFAIEYVATPVFALTSQHDASMAPGRYVRDAAGGNDTYLCMSYEPAPCDAPSVNRFGAAMAAWMASSLAPPHGAFVDSAFRHCSINCDGYDIAIDGTRAAVAMAEWYANGSSAMMNRGQFFQGKDFPCADCCS